MCRQPKPSIGCLFVLSLYRVLGKPFAYQLVHEKTRCMDTHTHTNAAFLRLRVAWSGCPSLDTCFVWASAISSLDSSLHPLRRTVVVWSSMLTPDLSA